jgi:hypothetical protein
MGLFVAPFAPIAGVLDNFAGQRAFDKHSLAVNMRNAASFVIQRFDFANWHGEWRGPFDKRTMIIIGPSNPALPLVPVRAAKRSFLNPRQTPGLPISGDSVFDHEPTLPVTHQRSRYRRACDTVLGRANASC